MKTIILGDTHGRALWKQIIEQNTDFDQLIFIGDYFDSREGISAEDQISNFLDIIEYKKTTNKKVVLLIGNHDHHYFKEIGNTGTSNYQYEKSKLIEDAIDINKEHLQISYSFDNVLFTHAGVSEEFLFNHFENFDVSTITIGQITKSLNKLWEVNKKTFTFNGTEGSGNNTWQTPIWIRPFSLLAASKNLKEKNIIQIVGHTQVKNIDIENMLKHKYFLIDALAVGEYLIIENGKFILGKI